MYSFPDLEPVCCSMSRSNHSYLTCIQIFQEAGEVVWYSHLFKNFPQFVMIHTVKGFAIVNKGEVDDFLELFCFFNDLVGAGNLISGSSAFSKTSFQQRHGLVVACCRVGGTECSSKCMGSFEGGHHYLHYLHNSLAPGK